MSVEDILLRLKQSAHLLDFEDVLASMESKSLLSVTIAAARFTRVRFALTVNMSTHAKISLKRERV